MAETNKEVEKDTSLKRSLDGCCSNDDSPEPKQNLKGDTPSVAVTISREKNHDFDKHNRERPTGLVFDEVGSNGSSNYCKLDRRSVTGGIETISWLSLFDSFCYLTIFEQLKY